MLPKYLSDKEQSTTITLDGACDLAFVYTTDRERMKELDLLCGWERDKVKAEWTSNIWLNDGYPVARKYSMPSSCIRFGTIEDQQRMLELAK